MGITRTRAYELLWSASEKAGVHDVALLTRWAIQTGLDEVALPDTPENTPEPKKKRRGTKPKVRMNRIRRARVLA